MAQTTQQHWSAISERGSSFGIKLLANIYLYGGKLLVQCILVFVIAYFFVTGKSARRASKQFLSKAEIHPRFDSSWWLNNWLSFRHLYSFGLSALDKVSAWMGHIDPNSVDFHGASKIEEVLEQGQGAIFLTAHLGNMEVCRALSRSRTDVVINVLVFTAHADKFNAMMRQMNPDVSINLIQVTDMGADLVIKLKDKIDAGELVFIVGDRTSVQAVNRVEYADFLGETAPFSIGPFVLANVLDCPSFLLFSTKLNGRFQVFVEPFSEFTRFTRKQRKEALPKAVQHYAQRLGFYAKQAPLQWFNFFDFWAKDDATERR